MTTDSQSEEKDVGEYLRRDPFAVIPIITIAFVAFWMIARVLGRKR